MDVAALPTRQVGEIEITEKSKWLIENLWLDNACGIIGGQAKSCKSWLGLEIAISVASGKPCLDRFNVINRGPALLFMAEDRVEEVYERVQSIAQHKQLDIKHLDVHLITIPVLRLDNELDRQRLDATVAAVSPRLLLLDPFVRLHRIDENNARDVSALLGYLREMERRHNTAIVLTHHAGKKRNARPGQGLRGSSDLHAFGDSNAYLARKGDLIHLIVEHRSASSIEPLQLRLASEPTVHLEVVEPAADGHQTEKSLEQRVLDTLQQQQGTLITRQKLREELRVNNRRLGAVINNLLVNGDIQATAKGLSIAAQHSLYSDSEAT